MREIGVTDESMAWGGILPQVASVTQETSTRLQLIRNAVHLSTFAFLFMTTITIVYTYNIIYGFPTKNSKSSRADTRNIRNIAI
jgi:hypothetical protein